MIFWLSCQVTDIFGDSDDDEDDFQPLSSKEAPTHDDIFGDSDDDEDENEAPRKQTHSRLKKGGNKASVSSKKREQSGLEDTDEEDDKPKKKDKAPKRKLSETKSSSKTKSKSNKSRDESLSERRIEKRRKTKEGGGSTKEKGDRAGNETSMTPEAR